MVFKNVKQEVLAACVCFGGGREVGGVFSVVFFFLFFPLILIFSFITLALIEVYLCSLTWKSVNAVTCQQ